MAGALGQFPADGAARGVVFEDLAGFGAGDGACRDAGGGEGRGGRVAEGGLVAVEVVPDVVGGAGELAFQAQGVAVDGGGVEAEDVDVVLVQAGHGGGVVREGAAVEVGAQGGDAGVPAGGEAGGAVAVGEGVGEGEQGSGAVGLELPAEVVVAPGVGEDVGWVVVGDAVAVDGDLGGEPGGEVFGLGDGAPDLAGWVGEAALHADGGAAVGVQGEGFVHWSSSMVSRWASRRSRVWVQSRR